MRAKEVIDRGLTEAEVLLEQAAPIHNAEHYEEWTHDCEPWDSPFALLTPDDFGKGPDDED